MTVLDIVDSCAYDTMSRNSKAYDQEFKENVINYVLEHPEEKYIALGNKFGVHPTTIGGWTKQYRNNDNQVIVRGNGNYASDEAKVMPN